MGEAGHREEEDRLGTASRVGSPRTAAAMQLPDHHRYIDYSHLQHPDSPGFRSHESSHASLPDFPPSQQPVYHPNVTSRPVSDLDEDLHPPPTAIRYERPSFPDVDPEATFIFPHQQAPGASAASRVSIDGARDLQRGADSHALAVVTPDEYYRRLRGASPTPDQLPPDSELDSMANPAASFSRARENSHLPSDANGPTPKYSGGSRVSTRSASAPIAPRSNAAARQLTVKDLTRRFDQNANLSSIPRVPVRTGIPTRPSRLAAANERPSPVSPARNAQPSYSALRTSTDSNLKLDSARGAAGTRSTQRTKFVAEDQTSTNSQSFASRIGKPRNVVSANAQASKSMTFLPHKSSPKPPHPTPPIPPLDSPDVPGRPLLFGEILPEQHDSSSAGYGIEGARSPQRRTSESSLHLARAVHHRALSDPDVFEPPSPTDWYRAAAVQTNGQAAQQPKQPKSHARAQSDTSCHIARQISPTQKMTHRAQAQVPSSGSRLPVSVRKLNSPTPSASASSPSGENSRANSPSNSKSHGVTGRTSRSANHPAYRAKTPTRAKTPIQPKTPTRLNAARQGSARGTMSPNDDNSLDAVIAAANPMASPPLRSSRPRQSVATATTASSRRKTADRSKTPHQTAVQQSQKREEPVGRRRKISVGPVDFAKKRETIRLAYSKSIRDSQVREAQLQVAERLEEEERAGAAVASREQRISEAEDALSGKAESSTPEPPRTSLAALTSPRVLPPSLISPTSNDDDSPTLGIPGSFPAASPPMDPEAPTSAVSATTETTEFDNEPASAETGLGVIMSASADGSNEHEDDQDVSVTLAPPAGRRVSEPKRMEYRYPFEEELSKEEAESDESVSIKVSVDDSAPSRNPQGTPQSGTTQMDYDESPDIGGPAEEYEPLPYSSPSFGTTVRIINRQSDLESHHDATNFSQVHDYLEPDYRMTLNREDARAFRRFARQGSDSNATKPVAAAQQAQVKVVESSSGGHLRDDVSSNRDSTCDSDAVDENALMSRQITPASSRSLMAPPPLSFTNRDSQQSSWTDYSIESTEASERSGHRDQESLPLPNPPFAAEARYRSGFSETSSARYSGLESAEASPLDSGDGQSSPYGNESHLPEVDTGEGFSVPYLSARASRHMTNEVPLPDYDPPPVPTPGSGSINESIRPPSSTYQADTRPGSTLVGSSIRDSEDFGMPFPMPVSTPHSADHISLEVRDPSLGGHTPVDSDQPSYLVAESGKESDALSTKERHRLLQRRNVIKELLDTEMVFVRDMNIVEEIYKGTAEACPKLDDKTIKLIFRNVGDIVAFHTSFLKQMKDAVAPVYTPHRRRSPHPHEDSVKSDSTSSNSATQQAEVDDTKDRSCSLGPLFNENMEGLKAAHEGFLRTSDHAAKRLIQIQQDPTVKVWLNECHEVAKDLTAAWDLDSLLIKPMQRITKYPNLIITLLQHTPLDHPDRAALMSAKDELEIAIIDINKTKKNFELVGQIVGRKRKESDVKAGFARAFGKRVDKLQASNTRVIEDSEYAKLHEKFGDDYLRLQVVLRDVEFYTRQVTSYVHEFLQYLSSMELVMRLQPGNYPELESKWVQFNVSMRDIEKVSLEQHLAQVRKQVIEPFESVIKAYGNPSLAMKKRAKRRVDYERAEQLKKSGKSIDSKLNELVEQYDALNETLKKELPQLSALTEKVGNICLGNFVNIQTAWYGMWKEKVRAVLGDARVPQVSDIVSTFQRDYKFAEEQLLSVGLLNPSYKSRTSQSTTATYASTDDGSSRTRPRLAELGPRDRGRSLTSDQTPALPTPDFPKRNSGQFSLTPSHTIPSPQQYYSYRDYYAGISGRGVSGQTGPSTPLAGEPSPIARSGVPPPARPSTGRSYDSGVPPRQSSESSAYHKRDSYTTPGSGYPFPEHRRYSGLFQSALPMPDNAEESQRSSRAPSREGAPVSHGYNILWLAASLFEFNIETTKHEAGYPYLTYQAGEIFDVVAEKGELWLAKNQDDPREAVGWIWSKHFAKLADS